MFLSFHILLQISEQMIAVLIDAFKDSGCVEDDGGIVSDLSISFVSSLEMPLPSLPIMIADSLLS